MIKNNLLPIRDRIIKALEELPENRERRGKYPKASGVHNTAIKRLMTGESLPGAENLIKISDATGYSVDYFLKGEKGILKVESKPENYDARPLAPIEADLLNQVMIIAEKVIKEEKRNIPPGKKADIITRTYNDCAEDHIKPDAIRVKRYLWMIKEED